jgi:hypothetical protein
MSLLYKKHVIENFDGHELSILNQNSLLMNLFIQMKIKKNINYESDFHQMDESEQSINEFIHPDEDQEDHHRICIISIWLWI